MQPMLQLQPVGMHGSQINLKVKPNLMKKARVIYLALVWAMAIACVKSETGLSQDKLNAIRTNQTGGESKRLIMENVFIDVDVDKLNQEINDHSKPKYQKPELAKARAALYRFYSHVKVEDEQYVCTLKSANEINISENFFKYLIDGQTSFNKAIKKLKAEDPKVVVPQITAEYLQSLLQ